MELHRQALERQEAFDLTALVASLGREWTDDETWRLVEQELTICLRRGGPIDAAEYARRFPRLIDRLAMFLAEATQTLGASPNRADATDAAPSASASVDGTTAGASLVPGKARPFAPGAKFGEYEILGVLGRGGMGVVYQARNRTTNAICALKTIAVRGECDDELMHRFHPHLRRLHLSASKCDERLDLSPFPELEELGLNNLPLTDAFAPQLAKLQHLRSLELGGTKLTDASAAVFASFDALQHFHAPPAAGDETLRRLESAPLRSLTVASPRFTEKSAASLAKRPALQAVHLDGPGLDDAHVAALMQCERLSQLTLKSGNLTDGAVSRWSGLKSVRRLGIHGTKITDATLRELGKLSLDSLELTDNEKVRGGGFDAFQDSPLTSLALRGEKFVPGELTAVRTCRELHTLVLAIGTPSRELFDALATAPKLHRIQVFQGEWTAEHFAQLEELNRLKVLLLQSVTANRADLEAFQVRRADCLVELQNCTLK